MVKYERSSSLVRAVIVVFALGFTGLPSLPANPAAAWDDLEQAGNADAYPAALRRARHDHQLTPRQQAEATVRLAVFLHGKQQQGFAETVEWLPPAIATLTTTAPDSLLLIQGHTQLAIARYRLQRLPEAIAPAETAARLARAYLDRPDLSPDERLPLYAALTTLATVRMLTGDEGAASPLFDEVITALETFVPDHPQLGSAYVNYGLILFNFGRFHELAAMMTKAERIFAAHDNPVALAAARTNHGLARVQLGDYVGAEPLLADGVARFEALGASQAPIYSNAVQNWGVVAGYLGQTDDAITRLNQALELRRARFGDSHPEVAGPLGFRARAHLQAGDLDAALADSAQALSMFATESPPSSYLDLELTLLEIRLQVLAHAKEPASLAAVHDRYTRQIIRFTRHQLAYGHEGERLSFLRRRDPISAAVATGDAGRIGTALLRFQGLGAEASVEDVQFAARERNPALIAALASWRDALSENDTDTEQLARIEARLATLAAGAGDPRRSLRHNWSDLARPLMPTDILGIFFQFQPWDQPREPHQPHYGFWYLSGQPDSLPQWRDLGPVPAWHETIARFGGDLDLGTLGDAYTQLSRELSAALPPHVWRDQDRLFLVPDGEFHQVPLAALRHPGDRHWAEDLAVLHLDSARDLLRTTGPADTAPPSSPRLLVLANPEFDSPAWTPLPEAGREGQYLAAHAPAAGWVTTLRQGTDATEAVTSEFAQSTHLHLATHSFGLPTPVAAEPAQRFASRGLILAHPRTDAWPNTGRELPINPHDGVLSALEILPLDLAGVELVTLAACATAAGSNSAIAHRYGLPQAFRRAGAAAVMASLWPVEDDQAREWMTAFYARLWNGERPAQAFARVQAEQLRQGAQSQGPAFAVRQAGAWVLHYRLADAE